MSSVNAVLAGKKGGLRVGYVLVALLLIFALFGAWIAPYDATLVNLDDRLLPASTSHWLGTDHLGRDVLSRLIVGTQWSLGSVVLVLGLVLILGVTIGGIAGIVGGKVDMFLMRLCDMFLTFPTLVLACVLIALL
ncbi:MAG: nickel ABC transporter permease subunit NikC, partial [Pseudomonas helleri]